MLSPEIGSRRGYSRRHRLSPALCLGPEQGGTVENVTLQQFWMPPSGLVTVNVILGEHILQGHPQPLSTAEPPANQGQTPHLLGRKPKT